MDVTALSDVQLDHMLGQIGADPFNEDYDSVEALRREKRRRLAARPQAPANVEQNLEASAAPMPMEPVVGDGLRPKPSREQMDEALIYGNVLPNGQPAGPGGGLGVRNTPEDLAAYAQVVGDANRRETERMRERVAARAAARGATGMGVAPDATDPDTVMVDGVEVPAYRLSDGRPFGGMFREGDYRAARDAAREAEIVDRVSQEAQEDLARYGDGTLNFHRYSDAMDGSVETVSPNEWDAKFQQVHGRPMTAEERTLAAQQAANLEQRRGMEKRQADQNRMLRNRPGMQDIDDQRQWSRNLIRARNLLAGGAQNINSGNVGYWNRLAMLPDSAMQRAIFDSMPLDQNRAAVEARRLDRAAELARSAITGQLAGAGQEGMMREMQRERRMQELRALAGKAKADSWGDPRADVEEALDRAGVSPQERAQILAEMFGAASAGPSAGRPARPPAPVGFDEDSDSGSLPATTW
jgi:hypothetical protein